MIIAMIILFIFFFLTRSWLNTINENVMQANQKLAEIEKEITKLKEGAVPSPDSKE